MPDHRARLKFVTGKGGVGKTTVAAALALSSAADGKRVLAVDAVNSGDLEPLIRRTAAALGLRPPPVLPLTTQDSLDEYVKRFLRVPIAPSSLGPLSRILEFVSSAAPGVREILIVGKIGHEAVNGPWDEIVVDAPASGHVVELLAAPASLRRLAPTGPLAGQTKWLSELLAAGSTTVVVVSNPEELPTAETGQLVERLRAETDVDLEMLIVNRVPPRVGPEGLEEASRLGQAVAAGAGSGSGSDMAFGSLAAVAVDRMTCAEPYVVELRELASSYDIAVQEVEDRPLDPVEAVMAVLVEGP